MMGPISSILSEVASYTATGRTRRRIQKRKEAQRAKDLDEKVFHLSSHKSYSYSPSVPFHRSVFFYALLLGLLLGGLVFLMLEFVPDPPPTQLIQDGGGEGVVGEDEEVRYWVRTRAKLVKVFRWVFAAKKHPRPHEKPKGLKGNPNKRVESRDSMWRSAEDRAIQKDSLDSTYHRSNMRWTAMQRGEQVTVELFLMSHCSDSAFCANLWKGITQEFPRDQVRVAVNYIGGGLERNKASMCLRGDLECDGNICGLCAQKYLRAPRHVLDLLACQSERLAQVPANLDHCLLEIGATIDEVEDIHKCIDFNEGQKLFELSASYAALVLPSIKRRHSCTMRVLDSTGKEKSVCSRVKGIYSTSCKHRTNAASWKKHICSLLGPKAETVPICLTEDMLMGQKRLS